MTEELKPCPFCGGNETVSSVNNAYVEYAECMTCGATGPDVVVVSGDARAAWNRRTSGWISVEERLPEPRTEVIVYGKGHTQHGGNFKTWAVRIGALLPDGRWFEDLVDNYMEIVCFEVEVTHWQPLPEPPEEERDD